MSSYSAEISLFAPFVVALVLVREGVSAVVEGAVVAFASVAVGFATVTVRREGISER